jgi:hypothetical protein
MRRDEIAASTTCAMLPRRRTKGTCKMQICGGLGPMKGLGVASRREKRERLRPLLRGTASRSLASLASCKLQRRSATPRRLKRTQGHAGARRPTRSRPPIDARRRVAEAPWSHDSPCMRRSGDVQVQSSSSQKIEEVGVCRPRRIDFQNGPDGCCCRISRRISCAFCATWEKKLGTGGRRGSGNSTTRSQSDDATSKRERGSRGL